MAGKGLSIGLGIVLLAGATWLLFFRDEEMPMMGGSETEAIETFKSDCVSDMMRWKALSYGNTSAQIEKTCECFGKEIHPVFKEMTRTQAAAYTESLEGRQRRQVIFQKCVNRFGLDGADVWYPGAMLDER